MVPILTYDYNPQKGWFISEHREPTTLITVLIPALYRFIHEVELLSGVVFPLGMTSQQVYYADGRGFSTRRRHLLCSDTLRLSCTKTTTYYPGFLPQIPIQCRIYTSEVI